jgi:hypothetical protein
VKQNSSLALKDSQFTAGKKKVDDELVESNMRLDGNSWKIDEEKKNKEKKRVNKNNENNNIYSGANVYNNVDHAIRNKNVPFYLTVDKEKKMREVRDALRTAVDTVFAELNDNDLLEAAKSRYLPNLFKATQENNFDIDDSMNITSNMNIRAGIRNCYNSLPATSPVRASFIQSIFLSSIPAATIASILNIDITNVYRALNADIEPINYFLRDLGFMRDRIGERADELDEWFIERCGPTSGRHKRYYAYGMSERLE